MAPKLSPPRDRRRSTRTAAWVRFAAPVLVTLAVVGGWEAIVRVREIPEYLLPGPSAIARALVEQWDSLGPAWLMTVRTMSVSLLLAVVGGVLLAVLFSMSRVIELSLYPYAVVLQVTPLVALAPLLLILVGFERTWLVLILCAWIVAFFPILAGATVGLNSADPGLRDLFDLYGASRLQRLRLLLTPTALPYVLAGLRTAVNLSLVGTVVGEFVTGASGAQSGLAASIFEGTYQSNYPLAFAALSLISLTGITCYFATHALTGWLLKGWHESTV